MNKTLTFSILTICLLLFGAYLLSSEHFLPGLRYKSMSGWLPAGAYYYPPSIARHKDSTYFLSVGAAWTYDRIFVPWFGDTLRGIKKVDGWIDPESETYIGTSDSTVIKIVEGRLIPVGTGTAVITLQFPSEEGIVTLPAGLQVKEISKRLAITQNSRP